MIRRPPRSTQILSSAASDVYKRQHTLSLSLSHPHSLSLTPTHTNTPTPTHYKSTRPCRQTDRRGTERQSINMLRHRWPLSRAWPGVRTTPAQPWWSWLPQARPRHAMTTHDDCARRLSCSAGTVHATPVWPSGKAGKQKGLGSIPLRLPHLLEKGCGVWTLSCDFVPHNE